MARLVLVRVLAVGIGEAMQSDRRDGPRAPFDGRARVRTSDFDIECRSVNLSWNGMLLLSPVSARPGLAMKLDVFLPQLEHMGQTDAVLMRQARHGDRVAWGVRFTRLSPFMGTVFRVFVRRALRGDYAEANESAPLEEADRLQALLLAQDTSPERRQPPPRGQDPELRLDESVPLAPITRETRPHARTALASKRQSTASSKPGAARAHGSGTTTHDDELASYLCSSDTRLRELYRDAVAEVHVQSQSPRKRRKRRFWPFR